MIPLLKKQNKSAADLRCAFILSVSIGHMGRKLWRNRRNYKPSMMGSSQ